MRERDGLSAGLESVDAPWLILFIFQEKRRSCVNQAAHVQRISERTGFAE
jgi:hypothetical protein